MVSDRLMATAGRVRRARYYPWLLFAIFSAALLIRCWPRLVVPQVWAEDGLLVLAGFIDEGWPAFFAPVNGYWQMIGKLITGVALEVSFYHYPLLSSALACLFAVSVGLAVALAPTTLRGRAACALAMLLVPTDPEVFGLPLYAFWWAGVLLLLLALWDPARSRLVLRSVFLLVGGLSSPLILLAWPVLWWRAWRYRAYRDERTLAACATPIALLQLAFIASNAGTSAQVSWSSLVSHAVPAFFGGVVVGNWTSAIAFAWLAGVLLIAGLATWLRRDADHPDRWMLAVLLLGTIALSAARADPALITAHGAGPRYFFYPFLLLLWIAVQCVSMRGVRSMRWGAVATIGLVLVNLAPVLTRFHEDLQWQAHVRSCGQFPHYAIPVAVDGAGSIPGWELRMRGADCRRLLTRDALASAAQLRQATFAYQAERADWAHRDTGAALLENTLGRVEGGPAVPGDYRVLGSDDEGAARGVLRLRMHKGGSLLYRSGPDRSSQAIHVESIGVGEEGRFLQHVPVTRAWVRLTFANETLPETFVVRIEDAGDGAGQWSQVALPATGE